VLARFMNACPAIDNPAIGRLAIRIGRDER
jgi:hypothetical protein